MTRLVIPKRTGGATHRDARKYDVEGDAYQDRVAKYIPAEVVGAYVSLDSVLSDQPAVRDAAISRIPELGSAPTEAPSLLAALISMPGIVFFFCLLLSPIYVWHMARKAGIQTWKMQAVIATAAFVVWAYAIKGSVFFQNETLNKWAELNLHRDQFYDPQFGAALLILFSLLVGFYQPKEGGES